MNIRPSFALYVFPNPNSIAQGQLPKVICPSGACYATLAYIPADAYAALAYIPTDAYAALAYIPQTLHSDQYEDDIGT
jgi:hypothetical protein